MSTTSQKHHNFVSEPMGDKPVTDLAGIGEVLGKRLSDQGFDRVSKMFESCQGFNQFSFQAFVVLGQYLVLKKDQELFVEWMKENAKANTKQANDCCQCLSEWCDQFL